MNTYLSKSVEETRKIAKKIADQIKNGGILCLYGDIGTGKTTFTQGMADSLGIRQFSVKSPTYTYIRKYNENIFHIDLYRLDGRDELLMQEIDELALNPNNIIIIEWADKLDEEINRNKLNIHFRYVGDNEREIKIKS